MCREPHKLAEKIRAEGGRILSLQAHINYVKIKATVELLQVLFHDPNVISVHKEQEVRTLEFEPKPRI